MLTRKERPQTQSSAKCISIHSCGTLLNMGHTTHLKLEIWLIWRPKNLLLILLTANRQLLTISYLPTVLTKYSDLYIIFLFGFLCLASTAHATMLCSILSYPNIHLLKMSNVLILELYNYCCISWCNKDKNFVIHWLHCTVLSICLSVYFTSITDLGGKEVSVCIVWMRVGISGKIR